MQLRRKHILPRCPVRVKLDRFGPDGQPDGLAHLEFFPHGRRPGAAGRVHFGGTITHGAHARFHKRCLADELRHKPVPRPRVHFLWSAHLKQAPLVQDRQPVGDGKRLLLVVRHVNRRQPRLLANAPDFGAHFEAQFGVEIG